MFTVSWSDSNGEWRDHDCLTAGERDVKLESLRSEGLDPTWQPIPGFDEEVESSVFVAEVKMSSE